MPRPTIAAVSTTQSTVTAPSSFLRKLKSFIVFLHGYTKWFHLGGSFRTVLITLRPPWYDPIWPGDWGESLTRFVPFSRADDFRPVVSVRRHCAALDGDNRTAVNNGLQRAGVLMRDLAISPQRGSNEQARER